MRTERNDAAADPQFLESGLPLCRVFLIPISFIVKLRMGKSGECLAFCVLPHLTTLAFSQVVRDDGLLRGVQQGDPGLRDGDAGADQRLPPGVLRLPAVQPQVRIQPRTGDRPFPITSINCRTPKGAPFLQRADAARDLFLQYRD